MIGCSAARLPSSAVIAEVWMLQGAWEDGVAAVRAAPNSAYAWRRLGVTKLELAMADLKVIMWMLTVAWPLSEP